MRSEPTLITGAAVAVAAFALVAMTVLTTDDAFAVELDPPRQGPICCSDRWPGEPASRPENADDRTVALEALQAALTNVPDGATFTWRRWNGRLHGAIKPAYSFKDANGHVCRHVIFAIASESQKRQIEGIACRLEDGSWRLDG
jgi:hypothetical protein